MHNYASVSFTVDQMQCTRLSHSSVVTLFLLAFCVSAHRGRNTNRPMAGLTTTTQIQKHRPGKNQMTWKHRLRLARSELKSMMYKSYTNKANTVFVYLYLKVLLYVSSCWPNVRGRNTRPIPEKCTFITHSPKSHDGRNQKSWKI